MKPTLVLGLALAANAMVADQELFVAPNSKLDRDLVQKSHGRIMFDEVADDELHNSIFYNHNEWLRKYDAEQADDELLIRPLVPYITADDEELFVAPQGKLADFAKKYPGMIMFDEQADDELALKMVYLPTHEHVAYDDDELIMNRDFFQPDGIRRFYTPYFDKETGTWKVKPGQYNIERSPVPHVAADDEFLIKPRPRESFKTEEDYQKYFKRAFITYDEVADDELRIRPISILPEPAVAADDELSFMPIPPKVFAHPEWFKITKTTPEALIRDDETNDELVYLGQLINDRPYVPRTFDDDELRAEKPSHWKTQEMSTERPKKQKKLRPHPDVIPMAEN